MTLQTINKNKSNEYKRLSVQVSLTGLSFLVSHTDTKDTLYFTEKVFDRNYTPEELLFEIQQLLAREEELQKDFSEVVIIYATNMYTVVPSSLFDDSRPSDYLKFNAKILANDFITHDEVDNHQMVVVYVPFVNINNYFFDQYGSFQYFHSASILLKTILDTERHVQGKKAFIHVRKEEFDMLVLDEGVLQLCNSYIFKTPEDFIYYVLFSLEQLHCNPDAIDTVLSGSIQNNDPLYEICYRYIRNISFHTFNFSGIRFAEDAKAHEHLILKSTL